jgi:hypothetical protein
MADFACYLRRSMLFPNRPTVDAKAGANPQAIIFEFWRDVTSKCNVVSIGLHVGPAFLEVPTRLAGAFSAHEVENGPGWFYLAEEIAFFIDESAHGCRDWHRNQVTKTATLRCSEALWAADIASGYKSGQLDAT